MKKLTENVRLLGNGYFNYFLVGNKRAALVECGTRASAAILNKQLENLDPKPEIKYLVALHSHFDHACGIPALKQLFPQALVVASSLGKKLLSKEKIVRELYKNDEKLSETYLQNGFIDKIPEVPAPPTIEVDMVVEDGDFLKVDQDLNLKIIDAPGHSICSIAAYLEKDQFMFSSDALGYMFKDGGYTPTFFSGFSDYINTIQKLMAYSARFLGPAHGDIIQGEAIMPFYKKVIAESQRIHDYLKEKVLLGYDESELTKEVYEKHIKEGLSFYPKDMMMESMYLLIKSSKAEN